MKRWPTAIVGGGRGGWCGTVVVSVFERTGEASPACRRTPAQHRERTFSLSVLRMVGGPDCRESRRDGSGFFSAGGFPDSCQDTFRVVAANPFQFGYRAVVDESIGDAEPHDLCGIAVGGDEFGDGASHASLHGTVLDGDYPPEPPPDVVQNSRVERFGEPQAHHFGGDSLLLGLYCGLQGIVGYGTYRQNGDILPAAQGYPAAYLHPSESARPRG